MSRKFNRHNVCNISYHIIWIPKYRKHILKNKISDQLKILLFEKATQIDIKIKAYEIMDYHIHLFIKGDTTMAISKIIQFLKGYTSFMLRKSFPFLKKWKSLWTHSYFCETIGFISKSTVIKYIANQRNNI